MLQRYVLGLDEVDRTQVTIVGGKGASLGALARLDGVRVPAGFCVTTEAFERVVAAASIDARLDELSRVRADDHEAIRSLAAALRRAVETAAIPDDLAAEIVRRVEGFGERTRFAVRSSATAEDTPSASFAGQHDSELNVTGAAAVLRSVSRCWASLFTERAVAYRLRHGFDHRTVHMAVVVQQMLQPQAAGTLFTAHPVSGHRKVALVEAAEGLGEDLVSGRVSADVYEVRDAEVIASRLRGQPLLTDAQVLELVAQGRRIEAHFEGPQDIEWCLVDGELHIVQSRPITTLFPIPVAADHDNRVYVSVGHQQMMTDAMKPLGLSLFKLTAGRPMHEAGGRLFVDVTSLLASAASRGGFLAMLERSDPLIGDALNTIVERGDFIRPTADQAVGGPPAGGQPPALEADPALVVELIEHSQASIAAAQRGIRSKSGVALLDFIMTDLQELRRSLFDPRSHRVFMSAIEATWWLNEQLHAWLGVKQAADTLSLSVPHNVSSQMGLALLDVADVIRPYPQLVAFLREVDSDDFLDELPRLAGGDAARDAIEAFLARYGMRCAGEIDITRPRWRERPTMLLPLLLGHVEQFEPGASARLFEQGRQRAERAQRELLARLAELPDGAQKVDETQRMIARVRTFIGYREYPKYGMISRYFVYKQALVAEAQRLVHAGVLRERDDIDYLTVEELHELVRTDQVDQQLIDRRKQAHEAHRVLRPPRVLTSDGEVITGAYRRGDLPSGALAGLAVSSGIAEGRARVILDMGAAELEAGDILVTRFTDPSWVASFVSIAGLVTEVGGLMTHGAVVAREYALPAVVGVEGATRSIRDGQRIRVNGTDGYVELLG